MHVLSLDALKKALAMSIECIFATGNMSGVSRLQSTITEEGPRQWNQVQKADIPSTITRELLDDNTMKIVSM
jgi:hypothetical protein